MKPVARHMTQVLWSRSQVKRADGSQIGATSVTALLEVCAVSMQSCVLSSDRSWLTFTQVADVFWELQVSAAQGGREEADGLLERRVEAGDAIENRVAQQLRRSRPSVSHTRRNNKHNACYTQQKLI